MQTDSRPTLTCSVLNKTAPPVHGADGTQRIRTRLNPAKPYQAAKKSDGLPLQNASRTGHCNFAYSALACFRMARAVRRIPRETQHPAGKHKMPLSVMFGVVC